MRSFIAKGQSVVSGDTYPAADHWTPATNYRELR